MRWFPVSASWRRQQTDQRESCSHHFPLFWTHISTFCSTSTLKTECLLHWITERETTCHKLWVQREILRVNAIFVCKFDSFPRSVLSSNLPAPSPTHSFGFQSLWLSDGKYFYTDALAVHGFSGELLFQSTIRCKSSCLQPAISEERSSFSRVYEARLMAEGFNGCTCYKVRFLAEDNFISPHK